MTRPLPHHSEVTRLLQAWDDGDSDALHRLMPLIFDELRSIARARFVDERKNHTLQPTALINELFIRLTGEGGGKWRNRARFFAAVSERMRHILIDHARKRSASKRGGDVPVQPLQVLGEVAESPAMDAANLLALDQALTRLGGMDARKARIIELRYFAGLSVAEVAEIMDISLRTAKREWAMARAWLFHELQPRGRSHEG